MSKAECMGSFQHATCSPLAVPPVQAGRLEVCTVLQDCNLALVVPPLPEAFVSVPRTGSWWKMQNHPQDRPRAEAQAEKALGFDGVDGSFSLSVFHN